MQVLKRSCLILAFLLIPAALFAQTGAISGSVSDASGAMVSGAQITVTNSATGLTRTAQSSDSGAYSLANLPVGTYVVEFQKQGFKPLKYENVSISVAQTIPLDAQFQVGSVQETVTVSSQIEAPVETESSQLSNLVDQRKMQALPLLTRNPYELMELSPGTATANNGLGGFSVNGARDRNNNFLLDGVDNNDTSVPGLLGGVLAANPESTQEFRVITNSFEAQFGRNTGAIVDVVTKSGTNDLHGNAYWFGRWNAFGGARDWFNPETDGPMNPYVRNQFGYSIGGPIKHNKTFFFFNHEMQRFRTTLTGVATVPTEEFKTGVFTYVDGNGNSVPVDLRPGSEQNLYDMPLDPTSQAVLDLFPAPTQLNADGFTGQVFFPSTSAQDSYQTVAKIDHHFNDRHVLSLRYGYDHFVDPNPFHSDILPGNVGGVSGKAIAQAGAANLTSTLTNSLVNEFTFGWNSIYAAYGCTGLSTVDSVTPQLDQFGRGWDFVMNGFSSLGCLALVADGQYRKTGTVSYADNLTWAHGSHTWKFGGDFRNVAESGPNSFYSRRQVDLRSHTTYGIDLIDVPGMSAGLSDAASALYGFVANDFYAEYFDHSGNRIDSDNKHFRQHEYSAYVQDSWKVRHNLTLNLGVRYQFNGVPFEENANFSNFLAAPTTFPVVFSLVGPGTGNMLYNNDFSNVEPRVGFSWDPWGNGRTAIRGAFGIFHDRVFGNLFGNARGNPPFEQDYNQYPGETLNDYFETGAFPLQPAQTTPSLEVPDGSAIGPIIFDRNFRNTVSNNWNFGIQHEMPGNVVLDVNYVGTKGTHIYRDLDGNPPDPNLVQQLVDYCSVPNDYGCTPNTVTKAFLYIGGDYGYLPFNAVAHNALVQPFYNRSVGNSIYNALQARVSKRMTRGFEVSGSYTWAHAIDDSNDPINPNFGNRGFPRNSLKLFEERGNSDNDVRHVASINYIWDLPIGKGKGYANHGVAGKLLEGWQISGLAVLQSGFPFDVFSNTDSERTGLSNRAALVGDPFAAGSNADGPDLKVFFTNPDAFTEPPYGGPGSVGRNRFHGPNFINFNTAISKNTKIGERVGLELRFEGYNIFNHPQFQVPGSDPSALGNLLGNSLFGYITSTVANSDGTTSARQLQVAMKLTF